MRFTQVNFVRKIAEMTLKHSNLPEEYIKKFTEIVQYQTPKLPQYRRRTVKVRRELYGLHRPWSREFALENNRFRNIRPWVEPIRDWIYFKGDMVQVLTGKDTGKIGLVESVYQERNWVVVRGLNIVYEKLASKYEEGVPTSVPLVVNREVVHVDPFDLKPTRIVWRYNEEGQKVRVSVRTGKIVPIPPMEEATYDYELKNAYIENEKDTGNSEIIQVTFAPKLKTFEMDLMDEYGIEEKRQPGKVYWY